MTVEEWTMYGPFIQKSKAVKDKDLFEATTSLYYCGVMGYDI